MADRKEDYSPIYLVKEVDPCNQKVTPSTLYDTQGTLVIKRSSHESFKSNPSNSNSGISLKEGEKDECAKVITERTPTEEQEIDKVSY